MNDIYKTHDLLKNKKTSVLEITTDCLKKADKSPHGAFISLLKDQALGVAKNLDQRMPEDASYLYGIPFNLKDLFITKDIRTTAGSKILYNYVPSYDGYVSTNLKKSGAILIGKTSCDEFGMGSTNENSAYGVVTNPLNSDFVPGGSSGATAVSIAEGSSYFGMGTDTGGSSRLPANFCGIVGFKPSYGRVSRFGQIAYASSLDQASPMAQTTLDIACVMEHLTTKDPRDATHAPLPAMKAVKTLVEAKTDILKKLRLGVPKGFFDSLDPEVARANQEAMKLFEKAGAKLVEVEFPHFDYAVACYYIIATSEACSNLARYDGIHFGHRSKTKENLEGTYRNSRSEGFGEEVKRRILLGTFSLSSGYYDAYYKKACQVRRLIAEDFKKAFTKCDLIFSPVCASTAFKFGEGKGDPLKMYMNDLYTIPVNLAGLPSLALPFGRGKAKMPTGFQLIGNTFQDESLLTYGHLFEKLSGRVS
jgi:aspartyl-tRNA(Asn)/glutamyl-tRNA(Gln) amidotransferase subunit A